MLNKYEALFRDYYGKEAAVGFYAASDADAKEIADDVARLSDASWVGLVCIEYIDVDRLTDIHFDAVTKPLAGSNNRAKLTLRYGIEGTQNVLEVSVPAVKPTTAGPNLRRITADPCSGVGKVRDDENVQVDIFIEGLYDWAPSRAAV